MVRIPNQLQFLLVDFSLIPIGSDVINSATFSPYDGGPVTIDHENTVKAYSVSPSMLGRGHTLLEPNGPVWVRVPVVG